MILYILFQWKGSGFSPPGLHQQEQKFPNFDSTTAWRDRRYIRDRYLIFNIPDRLLVERDFHPELMGACLWASL